MRSLHLRIGSQQLRVHRAAFHIGPQGIQPEKLLLTTHERMRLLQCRVAKQQSQVCVIVLRIFKLQNVLNTPVNTRTLFTQLPELADPRATIERGIASFF